MVGVIIGRDANGILIFLVQGERKLAIGVREILRARVIREKLIGVERAPDRRTEFRNWLAGVGVSAGSLLSGYFIVATDAWPLTHRSIM